MSQMPLLGNSLDELDPDQLSGVTSLAYESTSSEIALNFKQQGNDAYKLKSHCGSATFYRKAPPSPTYLWMTPSARFAAQTALRRI